MAALKSQLLTLLISTFFESPKFSELNDRCIKASKLEEMAVAYVEAIVDFEMVLKSKVEELFLDGYF